MKTHPIALFVIALLAAGTALVPQLSAQGYQDALRFSSIGNGVGSRALGMGNAYIGVSDDYSAVFWNPAGLGQMRRLEITGGLTSNNFSNSAVFFGNTQEAKTSSTSLDNLGFVFPFPTVRGSLVFAFGYNRIADFNSALSYNGFNDKTSIVPALYKANADVDMPYNVALEDNAGRTLIQKDVNQQGEVSESGSIGQWAFTGAMEIEEDLFLGISMNVLSGSYSYVRNFIETDSKNNYSDPRASVPIDSSYKKFDTFYYDRTISSDLDGINFVISLMYRYEDLARVGLVVHTPSTMTVKSSYHYVGDSKFDGGFIPKDSHGKLWNHYEYDAMIDYGVKGPWVFGVGASVLPLEELLLSADVEFVDWSQIEWTDNAELEADNINLKKYFRSVTNLRLGAEYKFPMIGLRLRGGLMYNPSPYEGDPTDYAATTVTGGIGFLLRNNVLLDGAVAFGSTKTYHNNYSFPGIVDPSRTDETIKTTTINVTLSYRF
jgi:long-subunit fatty acid transport protein